MIRRVELMKWQGQGRTKGEEKRRLSIKVDQREKSESCHGNLQCGSRTPEQREVRGQRAAGRVVAELYLHQSH